MENVVDVRLIKPIMEVSRYLKLWEKRYQCYNVFVPSSLWLCKNEIAFAKMPIWSRIYFSSILAYTFFSLFSQGTTYTSCIFRIIFMILCKPIDLFLQMGKEIWEGGFIPHNILISYEKRCFSTANFPY